MKTIYESEYAMFNLYVESFRKNAPAVVHDKNNDTWHKGYVCDIKTDIGADEDNQYETTTKGNYTGEFLTDDNDYYVGITTTGKADKTTVNNIKLLKNTKLYSC